MVYPRDKEELINFMNIRTVRDSKVIFFPCCSKVFDKEVANEVEKIRPHTHQQKIFDKQDKQGKFVFDKREIPHKMKQSMTYVPPANAPLSEWVRPTKKTDNNQC